MNDNPQPENGTPTDMEHGNTPDNGIASEQASGPMATFQDKMEKWTDRVGYGAKRGLICGLFTAWGFAVLYAIVLTVKVLTAQDDLDYEMMTFWEYVTIVGALIIGWTLLFVPVGVIVGAILGAVGIIRKKKKTDGDAQK